MLPAEMTIKQQWEGFQRRFYSEEKGFKAEHIEEVRKVFYAGNSLMFSIIMNLSGESAPVANDVIRSLQAELKQFVDEMTKGQSDG